MIPLLFKQFLATATVFTTVTNVGHIYPGGVITVQGVTTGGATPLNCVGCPLVSVNTSNGAITYAIPAAMSFSGTINNGATLAVSPVMVQQAKFVAPTALNLLARVARFSQIFTRSRATPAVSTTISACTQNAYSFEATSILRAKMLAKDNQGILSGIAAYFRLARHVPGTEPHAVAWRFT